MPRPALFCVFVIDDPNDPTDRAEFIGVGLSENPLGVLRSSGEYAALLASVDSGRFRLRRILDTPVDKVAAHRFATLLRSRPHRGRIGRPVTVIDPDGTRTAYPSILACATHLGVSRNTVYRNLGVTDDSGRTYLCAYQPRANRVESGHTTCSIDAA